MSNVNGALHSTVTNPVNPQSALEAELAKLRAENAQLKARKSNTIGLKVSEKGGVSVYGLGRFPVTLYREQWLRLLAMGEDIRSFITKNEKEIDAKSAVSKAAKDAK
jgi:hypothetical protein